jgi:hypothetical protein
VTNINDPIFDEPREHPGFRARRARLSRQAGSERLGLSLWEALRILAMSLILVVLVAGGVTIAVAGFTGSNASLTKALAVAFAGAVNLRAADLPRFKNLGLAPEPQPKTSTSDPEFARCATGCPRLQGQGGGDPRRDSHSQSTDPHIYRHARVQQRSRRDLFARHRVGIAGAIHHRAPAPLAALQPRRDAQTIALTDAVELRATSSMTGVNPIRRQPQNSGEPTTPTDVTRRRSKHAR